MAWLYRAEAAQSSVDAQPQQQQTSYSSRIFIFYSLVCNSRKVEGIVLTEGPRGAH